MSEPSPNITRQADSERPLKEERAQVNRKCTNYIEVSAYMRTLFLLLLPRSIGR